MIDPSHPGRLAGKVVLLTGTGGRQGRHIARLFASEGAMVVGCDLDESAAKATVESVDSDGHRMFSRAPVDLSDRQQAADWIRWAADVCGGIDVLYNNASQPRFAPVSELTAEDWHYTIRNELDLVYHTCHHAWPFLVERGGVILNTASVSAMRGDPGCFAHAASKGGIIALTRVLAAEGAQFNIRSNSISPGVILRDENDSVPAGASILERLFTAQLLPRAGLPADIGACALYLASDEAAWVTGANFVIDGGVMAV